MTNWLELELRIKPVGHSWWFLGSHSLQLSIGSTVLFLSINWLTTLLLCATQPWVPGTTEAHKASCPRRTYSLAGSKAARSDHTPSTALGAIGGWPCGQGRASWSRAWGPAGQSGMRSEWWDSLRKNKQQSEQIAELRGSSELIWLELSQFLARATEAQRRKGTCPNFNRW